MHQITKPTLIVDKEICKRNIREMASKAHKSNVIFRPHFKTHQSSEIAELFKAAGIEQITVSSIDMALYFASIGWNDITIAFPVNILQINDLNQLASQVTLNLVIENSEAMQFLNTHLLHNVNILLKIDAGYGRTGIECSNLQLIDSLIKDINSSEKLTFLGFLSHFGNTYNAVSTKEIEQIYKSSLEKLLLLKAKYPNAYYSVGDTPSCSVLSTFNEVNEIRPGNFVYYDGFQMNLGTCIAENIAVAMACPVVSVHAERNEVVIHGGAVHFSKESIKINSAGDIYGFVLNTDKKILKNVYLKKISQEHGIISGTNDWITSCKVGDIINIFPIHSCLTANLMKDNTIYT